MKLVLLSVIFLTNTAFSMGGECIMEIIFEYNGDRFHGYLPTEYWGQNLDSSYYGSDKFQAVFEKYYYSLDEITIYGEIKDQEILAKNASFSMHSYEILHGSAKTFNPKQMKDVILFDSWCRIAYGIEVLTPLVLADTSWISKEIYHKSYPIGNEIGCRLEVYHFTKNTDVQSQLNKLAELYEQSQGEGLPQTREVYAILKELKKKKVVVLELCGC